MCAISNLLTFEKYQTFINTVNKCVHWLQTEISLILGFGHF